MSYRQKDLFQPSPYFAKILLHPQTIIPKKTSGNYLVTFRKLSYLFPTATTTACFTIPVLFSSFFLFIFFFSRPETSYWVYQD